MPTWLAKKHNLPTDSKIVCIDRVGQPEAPSAGQMSTWGSVFRQQWIHAFIWRKLGVLEKWWNSTTPQIAIHLLIENNLKRICGKADLEKKLCYSSAVAITTCLSLFYNLWWNASNSKLRSIDEWSKHTNNHPQSMYKNKVLILTRGFVCGASGCEGGPGGAFPAVRFGGGCGTSRKYQKSYLAPLLYSKIKRRDIRSFFNEYPLKAS